MVESAAAVAVSEVWELEVGDEEVGADGTEEVENMTTAHTARPVKIHLVKDTWFISYQDRVKYQHYCAAQFYAPDHTEAWVRAWVLDRPDKFRLS